MCERLEGEVEVHEEDGAAAPWLQRGREKATRAKTPGSQGKPETIRLFLLNSQNSLTRYL